MQGMGKPTWLVTGGAGFIGVNFVHLHRKLDVARIINLDKLTYAGNPASLANLEGDQDHLFIQGDIGDKAHLESILKEYGPQVIVNFAAETHVDRSILGPAEFVETNVVKTFQMLQAILEYWQALPSGEKETFRFMHISTDEVYGTLASDDPAFSETTPYRPNSPYAASKASSDHFVRAFHHTYGLPVLTTNCSNNYGPFQFPEKLIPLMIINALEGKHLPVYGDGKQIRDWLYVDDHNKAIATVLKQGVPGNTYNVGGRSEKTNMDVVKTICGILDRLLPDSPHCPHENLITHVEDRPGHDRRYAINDSLIRDTLGWAPEESFSNGIEKTVAWYLENEDWVEMVRSGSYREWINANYENRITQVK